MIKSFLPYLIAAAICSCNLSNKYTVEVSNYKRDVINNNKTVEHQTEIIKAASDSEAYAQGFTNFCIHAKVYKQFNTISLAEPIAFRVLDKENMDIGYDLPDSTKRTIETSVLLSFQTESNRDSITEIIKAKDRISHIQDILDKSVTKDN